MSDKPLPSNDKILKMVKSLLADVNSPMMRELRHKDNQKYNILIRQKYTDFSISCPVLFCKIVDEPDKFEMKRLLDMMAYRQMVLDKKVSYDAMSSRVGQEYYDEFVKEKVEQLDKEKAS